MSPPPKLDVHGMLFVQGTPHLMSRVELCPLTCGSYELPGLMLLVIYVTSSAVFGLPDMLL